MKSRGIYPFRWDWHSICSAHRDFFVGCPRCGAGCWRNAFLVDVDGWVYRLFPRLWLHWPLTQPLQFKLPPPQKALSQPQVQTMKPAPDHVTSTQCQILEWMVNWPTDQTIIRRQIWVNHELISDVSYPQNGETSPSDKS